MADAHVLSQEYSDQLLPNTMVHLIETAFGIFGNFIVLLMYTKYVQDKTGTRYFIPVLALVDFAGCLSNVAQFHLDNTMRYNYPSVYLCKTLSFMMIMTGGVSAHTILAIALQRYLIICRPFGQQMSRKSCRVSILLIFLFSVGYAAPVLKFGGFYNTTIKRNSANGTRNISVSICHFDDGTNGSAVMVPYFGTLLLLSFINIVVTSVLYIPVTRTIYRTLSPSRRNRTSTVLDADTNITSKDTQSSSVEKFTMTEIPRQDERRTYIEPAAAVKNDGHREQRARKKISVMFLVIIIVYVVSYLTSLVTQVHSFATGIKLKGYELNIYFFCLRFNLLNHIANPYIYWFYDIKFRNELRRFCCGGTRRRYSFSM
ncbi:cholecystokinin receptor type A-like [Ostrea edulis]|uniref:cholecystokinin receptor type A-like n=1 Tax=Ostrea edulis TaxID=37623 RepID=UPI0020943671|nr:cholecystokinin receptor type A-like [Ostrea edulis]